MLKIHDLYGQTFAHEFQFSNPDSIKNAVKRYNMQRAAEREECRKDKEPHKLSKMRFCKMRSSGNDVLGMVTSRDLDVETQMSLQLKSCSSSSSCGANNLACDPPYLQRLTGGAEKSPRCRANTKKLRNSPRKPKQSRKSPTFDDAYGAHIAGLHRELCAELEAIAPSTMKLNEKRSKAKQRGNRKQQAQQQTPQKQRPQQQQKQPQQYQQKAKLHPKLLPKVEQFDENAQHEQIMARLKQVLSINDHPPPPPPPPQHVQQVCYANYTAPMSQWMDIIPDGPQLDAMNEHFCRALDTTPSLACLFMQEHGIGMTEPPPPPPQMPPQMPPYAEDSDLEQEYADRPGYMRYIERLPYASNVSAAPSLHKLPCFVELEPHPHWIRLQRSLKPMRYTSQRSDTDTLTLCEVPEEQPPQPQPKVVPKTERKSVASKRRPLVKRKPATEQQTTVRRQPGGREKPTTAAISLLPSTAALSQQIPPQQHQQLQPKRRKQRNVICTRSLENLKYQKMAIYNRISLMQERIITALDRLQGKLLQLQMPTCSNQEKQRRERNAFEFCVRFSRNFLYPLRGLIEDVRCTPVGSFHSANSNEASQRVVCVYALMHNSIRSYRRKLRYFLLDKVPQKLSALIEMMYTLTNVCLDKGVLDRQDPVVECLQQRCTSFITFIEDMQQERFQLARETYRRMQKHQRAGVRSAGGRGSGMHERYDLKMFLNDLKLYEPRLVPKEKSPEKRRPRGWLRRHCKHMAHANGQVQSNAQSGNEANSPHEQQQQSVKRDGVVEVPTHIECVHCGDCRDASSDCYEPSEEQKLQLSNILALLQQPHYEKHELHQKLLQAMEHVTKSQVREVLDPLVRSLGAILDKKYH
ncbi:uncharacterized protein LOC117577557 [Drosophila albomicans]|uniref:Uncharacterized protein LOC117577557 n=1 Tax=Drosophila albomicans TaxID=7291 RepID=A0A6P8XXS5_DROAB|nr:uncharacterized protein LOC117577557 [Drosophila albomicans]